jgi:cytochrome c oxidase subunit 2
MERLMQCLPRRLAALAFFMMGLLAGAHGAFAADTPVGQPRPWEVGMQASAGPIKDREIDLHSLVFWIITVITIAVAALLAVVMLRFNERKNPTPSQTSHNSILEVAWTVVPVLILVVIAIPSFRLVFYEDRTHDPDMTIKVVAHQWYWEYSYPDNGKIDFESRMIDDGDQPGHLRLLDVDNPLVLPVNKNIRILTTSADVIHSFFIPAAGVQRYAIQGKTIETWIRLDKTGTFYGECNQICGENHSRMPIAVKGVTDQEFEAWVTDAKKKWASTATPAADPAVLVASAKE